MINEVVKRNGTTEKFDANKITRAIWKAVQSIGGNDYDEVERMTKKVIRKLKIKLSEITVESIQDAIETVLIESKHVRTAKAFILYREKRRTVREDTTLINATLNMFNDYLEDKDWKVNENSNTSFSIAGLNNYVREKFTKQYWMNQVYNERIRDCVDNNLIHIHDTGMFASYCLTGDTKIMLLDGTSKPIKDLVGTPKIEVYSIDKQGNPVPAIATNIRLTKRNATLVKVGFYSAGKHITNYLRCTPDHKILKKDNTFIEAQHLKVGDSLTPLYFMNTKKYRRIVINGKAQYEHRYFMSYLTNSDLKGKVVHHIDGNKQNNNISNLEVLNDKEHRSMELKKTREIHNLGEIISQKLSAYNKTDEKRKQMSELTLSRMRTEQGQFYNHKVTSVEFLEETEDVYCMEVPVYHNFAIEGGIFVHNCNGWDLKQLLLEGLKLGKGKVEANPARHFDTALRQMVNATFMGQLNFAGAQAWSSFDTLLAPFIRLDDLGYEEVKQALQSFIHELNIPSRTGEQTPFTNLTFDVHVPKSMENEPVITSGVYMSGKHGSLVYGDYQLAMNVINKAFCEVMLEGDAKGRPFTFPIPTLNITPETDFTSPVFKRWMELTSKYGSPYFCNYINSDMSIEDSRSMCCRLKLDTSKIRKGGIFSTNAKTGSIGVVTLNLPRIAYESKLDSESIIPKLKEVFDIAVESLELKRNILEKQTDRGLYPFVSEYFADVKQKTGKWWTNHFSTIGIIGMNEVLENLYAIDIGAKEGINFSIKVMTILNVWIDEVNARTGNMYNLEASPAEGTCYSLAKKDKDKYPDIITAGTNESPYYTNSTQLPVGYTDNPFEAVRLQDSIQSLYTGGTVQHLYLGQSIEPETCAKVIKKIFTENKLPYISITPTYSICPQHGYIVGEVANCPTCDAKTEIWSRVTGYLRPTNCYNIGKKQEFKERKTYKI